MTALPEDARAASLVAEPPVDIAQASSRGVTWNAAAQVLIQVSSIARTVVLARLLAPRDFGVFALLALPIALAALVSESGIGMALVQRRQLDETHLHTAFWMQLALSAFAGGLLALAGPLLTWFFHRPLTAYCIVLGAGMALSNLATVHAALLQRTLRFTTIAIRSVVAAVLGIVVSIVVGVVTRNAWALVLGSLATMVASNLTSIIGVRFRPKFRFDRKAAREIAAFSAHATGIQALAVVVRNYDNVLVGRGLGTTALGYYSRGYQVLLFPLDQVTRVIGNVMFPALAALQHEDERSRKGYLRAVAGIALVAFPLLLGAFVVAPELVSVMLGPKWEPVVPLVRIFAIVGVIESITSTVGWIYQSRGRVRLMLVMMVVSAALLLALIVIGVAAGQPRDVAIALLVGMALLAYPVLAVPYRFLGLKVRDGLRVAAPPMACAFAMGLVVASAHRAVQSLQPTPMLLLELGVGAVTYVALVFAFRLRAATDLLEALRGGRREGTTG